VVLLAGAALLVAPFCSPLLLTCAKAEEGDDWSTSMRDSL